MGEPDKVFWMDLETGGTNEYKHPILTLSAGISRGIDPDFLDTVQVKMRPPEDMAVSSDALEVTGLTEEEIHDFPPHEEAFEELYTMLRDHAGSYGDRLLVGGYNVDFDVNFLTRWWDYFEKTENVDPIVYRLRLNRKLDPYPVLSHLIYVDRLYGSLKLKGMPDQEPENMRLGTVADWLGIEVDEEQTHSATYDVELARKVYDRVMILSMNEMVSADD